MKVNGEKIANHEDKLYYVLHRDRDGKLEVHKGATGNGLNRQESRELHEKLLEQHADNTDKLEIMMVERYNLLKDEL